MYTLARCGGRVCGAQGIKGLILRSRSSVGRASISPDSLQRTAQSTRLRYSSKVSMFPTHSVPEELVTTMTFGTSQGPTQPLIVSCTRFNSPRFRHSFLSHSTGTSGNPRSVLPQQHPWQIVSCPITRRFVLSVQSRFDVTVSPTHSFEEALQRFSI